MTLSRLDQIGFVLGVIALTPVITIFFNARSLRRYAERQAHLDDAEEADRLEVSARRGVPLSASPHELHAQGRRSVAAARSRAQSIAAARSAVSYRALVLGAAPGPATGIRAPDMPRRRGHPPRDRHTFIPPARRPAIHLRAPVVSPPQRPWTPSRAPGVSPPQGPAKPPRAPSVAPLYGPSTQSLRAPLTPPTTRPQPTRAPGIDAPRPVEDRTLRYLVLVAIGLSLAATAYFYHHGQLVLYDDELSRMSIARRTFDNPIGFSLAQLGGVWLPWPQLQMMPFLAVDSLYFDGLGGSVPSMLSYVASSVLIYKIVFHLAGRRRAPAIAGAAVFMLNPNVLYMQSTALSELGMFLWLLGGVYGVQRFFEVERRGAQRRYLALAGISCTFALLTRYEGWIVTAALLACVIYGCARRGDARSEVKAYALAFSFFPALAVVGWLAYNQIIFGSALYFYDGPYAKPSLWSSSADPAVGHWLVSAKTYLYAILDDTNWPTAGLALAGIFALVRSRRPAAQTLPVLSLLLLIPFFIWSLHGAQRPMHVEQINHSWYNTRFALVYMPAAAIYIGYLIGALRSSALVRVVSAVVVGAAVAAVALSFGAPDATITTLEDNLAWSRQPVATQFASAAAYLRAHYHHGLVLAQFFANEGVLYEARIAPAADVYEGIHQLWLPAIADPARAGVRWVVMRTDAIDRVYRSLHGSKRLLDGYTLVYDRREYQIYEQRGCRAGAC